MSKQDRMDGFKLYYEKFLIACDAQEESLAWPVEELGELDAWLSNEMSCLMLRLIAADGVFRPEEAARLNEALGFGYTAGEMEALYADCGERIDGFLEEGLPESLRLLARLNPLLEADYREMLRLLARLVIESDEEISPAELAAAEKLLAAAGE